MIEPIVAQVLASSKYRSLDPDFVRNVAVQIIATTPNRKEKELIKAVKNKLHQVANVYHVSKPDYAQWLNRLQNAVLHQDDVKSVCREIMAHHASTRERLLILDDFYKRLFAGLSPISSILDLACGLNPLSLPWMGLSPRTTYWAYDIYQDQVEFLNHAFALLKQSGQAEVCDLLQTTPRQPADVALLLKTLPCLEQIDKTIGVRLLAQIQSPIVLVSFPIYTLGGRNKGMRQNYETYFRSLLAEYDWHIESAEFANEIVFRIYK
jgi:16S rRNA (guanine(1405)-N(7))-methyltransferase